ncbi:uncharacterized protein LOC142768583 isoform X4 [Rhipicephalus microplus]|uniref:uncharacterized protein LOC142768583 isoform X4 n=1 Tax=Rhipicephalus microplus TaxID=6941 RepID=UPI003F6BC301
MTYRVDMLISRASTGCFLSLLYLLYALAQGPSCAYAATAKPVTSESARPAGREQLLDHPDLRGSGPPPVTQFLHQGSPPRNQGLVHLGPPQRGRPFLLREYQFLYGRLA